LDQGSGALAVTAVSNRMDPHSPLILCKDLWKVYRLGDLTVAAVRGVTLEMQRGEFVAIMGASGSGKTTLMNILGCLDRPTQGTYLLGGRDIGQTDPNALAEIRNREIGFVFQNFSLIPRTSALENVQLPLIYRSPAPGSARLSLHEQRALAAAALARVGLADRQHHYPSQLSGGQQQRVAIARALVVSPSILLADEPTGNLDSKSGEALMQMFAELHAGGATVCMVTHDPRWVTQAQRHLYLFDGRLVDRPVDAG
jgi:putative ABC transport system ATP-binding protein